MTNSWYFWGGGWDIPSSWPGLAISVTSASVSGIDFVDDVAWHREGGQAGGRRWDTYGIMAIKKWYNIRKWGLNSWVLGYTFFGGANRQTRVAEYCRLMSNGEDSKDSDRILQGI